MRIGITGHQDLSKFDLKWIEKKIENLILEYTDVEGVSSLAIGADQLFAELLIKHSIKYDVIVPCEYYESTFKDSRSLESYKSLLRNAESVITLSFAEPSESAFFEAGVKVVEISDILIAVWDGEKAKGLGGTGDIVEVALNQSKKVIHINPVKQISIVLNNG